MSVNLYFDSNKYKTVIDESSFIKSIGKIVKVIGLVIESLGPDVHLGEICYIRPRGGERIFPAEVVGFRDNNVLLMPLGSLDGIGPGCEVIASGEPFKIKVGSSLLGRVLDGLGNPIDENGAIQAEQQVSVYNSPPNPLSRKRIDEPLTFGVKAIDGVLTCGKGQRIGIFAGSGVGKSTLLGMIARNTDAQVNVIGLIGERGREVREFIERDLGEEGLKRSVLVVATSEQPALVRLRGALVATTIAEYFRDQGMNVMLMMDSVTRFAMAQREVGLAIGEPPATRGYTPSVFALLPKLLERSGAGDVGTITALYTVLVDGDDMNEPIADAVRGILDGHIVLSRDLAMQNHYPAIDVLASVSRVINDIVGSEHLEQINKLKLVLSTHREAEDLINIGAYNKGSNPKIDYAIKYIENVRKFLQQKVGEKYSFNDTWTYLSSLFS